MSRRYVEVRRFMDFSGLVYGYLAMPNTTAGGAARCFTLDLAKMRPNAPITVGLVFSDTWRPMKTTVESHKDIAYAVGFLVTNVFPRNRCRCSKAWKSSKHVQNLQRSHCLQATVVDKELRRPQHSRI